MFKYKKPIPSNAKITRKVLLSPASAEKLSHELIERNIFFEMYNSHRKTIFYIYPKIKYDDMLE